MEKTYFTINKLKDKCEIIANITDEKLDEKKVTNSVKQIVKFIKTNDFKKKDVIINTNLDLEKDEREDNQRFTLISALNACKIKNKKERLEYIYMAACKYLDNEFFGKNICEFCDDICLGKKKYNAPNGCCHPITLKTLFTFKRKIPLCKFNVGKTCINPNLACKLYACTEVHKKGYNFNYYNVALVRYFFNFIQKIIIRCSIFESKDKILKRLNVFNF